MPDGAKTVLIFEDNTNIQLLLRLFFQKRGFQTHVSGDGVDAVALAERHRPDLIIMDVIMPGKDGIEACADLRRAGVSTPVVMLTSKAFNDDKDFAMKAGANAYLLKPINPADLEAAIHTLLGT